MIDVSLLWQGSDLFASRKIPEQPFMIVTKTNGLIAAPFTPMSSSGELNLEAVKPYAHWLCDQGLVGAFICGTTGEGMSLTIDERRQLAERWVRVSPPELPVIVHVGHNSLADCRALAAHAQAIGAASVACMSPFFFKPLDVDGLLLWCQQVAAAAPELPFYYYHIPSMTGFSVAVHRFLQLAGEQIPNLAGVKFTFEDLDDFGSSLQVADGRFDVLFGRDELLHSALQVGARGAVGSTYNFAAPLYLALIKAFHEGDQSRAGELQQVAVRMIDALVGCGAHPIATFKHFMGQVGVDCGPTRLPLQTPTSEQLTQLEIALAASGIDDWIARDKATAATDGVV